MKVLVQTPTPKLAQSLDFYARLRFSILSEESPSWVSDGSVIVEINPDRFARAGVKLYQASWADAVAELSHDYSLHPIENGHLLSDPSGTWIYLMEAEIPDETTLPEPSSSALGKFAGVSLETTEMEKSGQLWEKLGFTLAIGSPEQGWMTYTHPSGMAISLMKPLSCPHLFFNPSLTYFNGNNNPAVINEIRKRQIPLTEEITHFNKKKIVDNVILRDPGGLGFFVFNDG